MEQSNSSPYGIVHTLLNFEKQLSGCSAAPTGVYSFGVTAITRLASGGYLIATAGVSPGADISAFDAGFKLISKTHHDVRPIAFADLNGDGEPDAIGWAHRVPHISAVAVGLGKKDGSFQTPAYYPVGGNMPSITAIAAADLNGDHKLDIVAAVPEYANVIAFFGNGDGTMQEGRVAVSGYDSIALAVADLNGDGHADLAFTAEDYDTATPIVGVALGVGDGTFGAPVTYPVADVQSITVGDVNGDGVPDIVTSGMTILYGDGRGRFHDRRDVLVETFGNLMITDFDGDGNADVVAALGDPGIMAGEAVSVVYGSGKGLFTAPPVSPVPNRPAANSVFTALAAADLNGDGIPDLVSAENLGHVAVLKGASDGSFQSAFEFRLAAGLPLSVTFADLNHDGALDFAVVGSGTPSGQGEVDILLSNGRGSFRAPIEIPAPLGATAAAAADFNGDGKTDLALLVSRENLGASDEVRILLGNGDGTFVAGTSYPVGPFTHSLAAGDFNGDGKTDLAVADAGTYEERNGDGNIAVLVGKGDGTFAAPVVTPLTGGFGRGPYNVVAADFNRDGRLDLAVTLSDSSNYAGGLAILTGRGDGTFGAPAEYAADAVSVQAGDLNGDGIPDLVIARGVAIAGSGVSYLLGNGDGSFGPPIPLPRTEGLTALADFNRDGKLDVVTTALAGIATFLNAVYPVPSVSLVSAASFAPGPLAPDSIVTAFGKGLPAAGVAVSVTDVTGTTLPATVLYTSPTQINFIVPGGIEAGPAAVAFASTSGGTARQSAEAAIAPVAPAIFTVNEGGLPAAYVTRVAAGGGLSNEPVFSVQNGVYSPVPIDVTVGRAYLVLFGTGIRHATGAGTQGNAVRVFVNGDSILPDYAGPQPSFAGLDQVNVLLPASLAGRGCVSVALTTGNSMSDFVSNTVYVCIR